MFVFLFEVLAHFNLSNLTYLTYLTYLTFFHKVLAFIFIYLYLFGIKFVWKHESSEPC